MNKDQLLAMTLGDVLKSKAALAAFSAMNVSEVIPAETVLRNGVVRRNDTKRNDAQRNANLPKASEPKASEPKASEKVSIIAAAPAKKSNVVATLEIVEGKNKDGGEILFFKVGKVYNHAFRGWHYANTKKIDAPPFRWNGKENAWEVEPERAGMLMTGIRSTYGVGTRIIMGNKVETLA